MNQTKKSDFGLWIYFLGILIISPVFFLNFTLDHQLIPRFFIVSFFLAIVSVFILIKIKTYSFPVNNPVLWLLIIFYLFNVSSIIWSVNIAEGILESQRVFIGLCIFFYTLFFSINFKGFEVMVIKAVLMVDLVIIWVGTSQWLSINKFDSYSLYSLTSVNSHKNLMSSILFLSLPFLFNGFILLERRWRWLIGICITLTIIFIFILQTRSVWLGLLVSSVLLGIIVSTKSKFILFIKKFLLFLLVTTFLAGITSLIYLKIDGTLGPYMKKFNIAEYKYSETGLERLQIWEKSLCVFNSHRLFGVGAGNWQIMFPSCSVWNIWRLEHLNFTFQRPHNDFLWVLCELGIMGTLPLLLIFFIFLVSIISVIRKAGNSNELMNVCIYGVAFIGYLTISFFDFPKERIEHVIFSSTLLGLIFYKLKDNLIILKKCNIKIKHSYFVVLIILLTSFNLIIGINRINGEFFCKKMYVNKSRKNWKKTIDFADKATTIFYSIDPTSVPIHWYRGIAGFQLQNYQQALVDFQKARYFHPYNFHVLNNLGSTCSMLGNDVEAEKLYLEALNISPNFDDPKLNLAAIYYKQGKFEAALHYVNITYNDSQRKREFLKVIQKQIHY